VTAAKNEENLLPRLATSIIRQSVKPLLWVIVDDGSEDKTASIIKDLKSKYNWVKGLRLHGGGRYSLSEYGDVLKKGFEYAIRECKQMRINYDFLGIVDADIVLGTRYFEKLLKESEENSKLGIASGIIWEKNEKMNFQTTENVRGAAMFIRRECYEMIDGISSPVSPDTVLIVKAKNRGWQVRTFHCVKAIHQRKTFGKINSRRACKELGEENYYLNYHPINAFLTGIYYAVNGSPSKGLSFLVGYSASFLLKKKKIGDEEIKEYFWSSFNRLLVRVSERYIWKNERLRQLHRGKQ